MSDHSKAVQSARLLRLLPALLLMVPATWGCSRSGDPVTAPERQRRTVEPEPDRPDVGPQVGDLAPEIEGEDLEGKKLKLSDYRGKVVFLQFWSYW